MTEDFTFKDKVILIVGSGSMGKSFAKRMLEEDLCKKVIIFSLDEGQQKAIRAEPIFKSEKARFFLGDVRDAKRLRLAFDQVNCILCAGALKDTFAAEYDPLEFIKTNIMGSMNVLEMALEKQVEKVITISNSQAVDPNSFFGSTKQCADKLFVAGNAYAGAQKKSRFAVVRYGNVLDGETNILSYWKKLLRAGIEEFPISDLHMTGFWITLKQAVDFTIKSFKEMEGGEIFVPKIPGVKLIDLGETIAPDASYVVTGLRPGEKLHELLISSEEARHTIDCGEYYIIVPESIAYDPRLLKKFLAGRGKTFLPDKFSYCSEHIR